MKKLILLGKLALLGLTLFDMQNIHGINTYYVRNRTDKKLKVSVNFESLLCKNKSADELPAWDHDEKHPEHSQLEYNEVCAITGIVAWVDRPGNLAKSEIVRLKQRFLGNGSWDITFDKNNSLRINQSHADSVGNQIGESIKGAGKEVVHEAAKEVVSAAKEEGIQQLEHLKEGAEEAVEESVEGAAA